MRKNKRLAGFTLIELLVVMAVIVLIGSLISVILFSSLRGANKTGTETALKQNGNFAISQMAKSIRFAKRFDGVSVNGSSYTTNCVTTTVLATTPTPTPIPYKYVKITALDGGQTTYACGVTTIASNSASLLDTSVVTVSSCSFSCSQQSVEDFPTINILFTLSSAKSSTFFEQKGTSTFQTGVTMRNALR